MRKHRPSHLSSLDNIPAHHVTTITSRATQSTNSSSSCSGNSTPATPASSTFPPFCSSDSASAAASSASSPVASPPDSAFRRPMTASTPDPCDFAQYTNNARPSSSRGSNQPWPLLSEAEHRTSSLDRGLNLSLECDGQCEPEDDQFERYLFGDAVIDSKTTRREHERQKSGDHSGSSFSSKFRPKRWMHRKNSSLSTSRDLDSPGISSRTSSFTSCNGPELPVTAALSFTSASKRSTAVESSAASSPVADTFPAYEVEPIDRKGLSSTPLLPPMLTEQPRDASAVQSPLQSPTVAEGSFRGVSTISTGSFSLTDAPMLSRSSTINSTDFSSSALSLEDKWSELLGHANFTILPAPYMPLTYDRAACHRLFADWEAARGEYFKHQARTQEHYGPNSTIYRLTEEKWNELEGQWRRMVEEVTAKAVAAGERSEQLIPPRPVNAMPSAMPHLDSKFPQMGDSDIVGRLIIQSAQDLTPGNKKPSKKVFGDWKFSFRGKYS